MSVEMSAFHFSLCPLPKITYMYIQVNGLILIKCNHIHHFKSSHVRPFNDFFSDSQIFKLKFTIGRESLNNKPKTYYIYTFNQKEKEKNKIVCKFRYSYTCYNLLFISTKIPKQNCQLCINIKLTTKFIKDDY